MAVGQEAVVADAVEAVGQRVQEEAADELVGVERHHLGLVVVPVVLPAEADPTVVRGRPGGCWRWRRDGCSGRDRRGPARGRRTGAWRRRPSRPGAARRRCGRRRRVGQAGEVAEEAELAGVERGLELLEEQPAEQPRRARAPAGRSPAGRRSSACHRRQPATGDDAVDVRMMVQVLPPGVQHRDDTDLGAEMLGIGGDGAQRLGRRRNRMP